ncbi:MAG: radical SAM protein [Planctomycetota bacterium]
MRVLLLNPPSRKRVVRARYCSSTSKASYLFYPTDLVVLSGFLAAEHEVAAIDSIASRLGVPRTLERIRAFAPEAIVALVGAVSWEEDVAFLRGLKVELGPTIIANGDVFFEDCARLLVEHPFLDAVTFNFMSADLARYLRGELDAVVDMAWRSPDGSVCERRAPRGAPREVDVPVPRHELFPIANYRFPFAREHPFASIMSAFGCPFRCAFCIGTALPLVVRPIPSVIAELAHLRDLGISELFIEDYTFGAPRARALRLCREMARSFPRLSWTCFSRVDVADEELLVAMRGAGCHTVIFGVESGSDEILAASHKGFTTDAARRTFALCRRLGIRTVATFVLGLPDDTRQTLERTIDFACEIGCDYASFNVAVPRSGTALRKEALKSGLIGPHELAFDHSGDRIAMPTRTVTRPELSALKRAAVGRFYLRPGFLLRRALGVRSLGELREHFDEAVALLRKN